MNSFHYYVTSTASIDLYPDNTGGKFKNNIATPLNLEGEWEVGLHSITCKTFDAAHLTPDDEIISLKAQDLKNSDEKIDNWKTYKEIKALPGPYILSKHLPISDVGIAVLIEVYRGYARDMFHTTASSTSPREDGIKIFNDMVGNKLETYTEWIRLYPPHPNHIPTIDTLDDVIKICNDTIDALKRGYQRLDHFYNSPIG